LLKAAVWYGGKDVRVEDVQEPRVGADDVLIKVRAVGICGSDLHAFEGLSKRRVPPLIMGHEFAGDVVELGSNVKGLVEGVRVTVEPMLTCGECGPCKRGQSNICLNLRFMGLHTPGALAEYVAAPAHRCYTIPEGVTYEEASLAEPLAVAVHAVNRTAVRLDDDVLLVGGGIIGLLILQVSKRRTTGQIIVTDLIDRRLRLAESLGADITVNPGREDVVKRVMGATSGQGVNVAVEVVGLQATLQQAVASVRKGGSVTVVGLLERMMTVDMMKVVSSEVEVRGTYTYAGGDFETSLNLIRDHKVNLEPFLAHTFPLEEVQKGFEAMAGNGERVLKAIIKP